MGIIRNFDKNLLVKKLRHSLRGRGRTSAEVGTLENFQNQVFFLRGVRGVTDLFVFKITFLLKHQGDLRSIGKIASRYQVSLRILSKLEFELNRFGVGQSISPLYSMYIAL